MQIVGEKLEQLAFKDSDNSNSDLLGRSAFNRFYYAAFLETRKTLGDMKPNWKGTPHAEIPKLLKMCLKNQARKEIDKQVRAGIIDQNDKKHLLTKLQEAANELADLLIKAYDARVIADYEPEIKTVRDKNTILLKAHTLSSAKKWPTTANKLCGRLLNIWKQIGCGND